MQSFMVYCKFFPPVSVTEVSEAITIKKVIFWRKIFSEVQLLFILIFSNNVNTLTQLLNASNLQKN